MGLAIARQIVDSYQGDIDVESKEGEGTKFIIVFPIEDSENKDKKEI